MIFNFFRIFSFLLQDLFKMVFKYGFSRTRKMSLSLLKYFVDDTYNMLHKEIKGVDLKSLQKKKLKERMKGKSCIIFFLWRQTKMYYGLRTYGTECVVFTNFCKIKKLRDRAGFFFFFFFFKCLFHEIFVKRRSLHNQWIHGKKIFLVEKFEQLRSRSVRSFLAKKNIFI